MRACVYVRARVQITLACSPRALSSSTSPPLPFHPVQSIADRTGRAVTCDRARAHGEWMTFPPRVSVSSEGAGRTVSLTALRREDGPHRCDDARKKLSDIAASKRSRTRIAFSRVASTAREIPLARTEYRTLSPDAWGRSDSTPTSGNSPVYRAKSTFRNMFQFLFCLLPMSFMKCLCQKLASTVGLLKHSSCCSRDP